MAQPVYFTYVRWMAAAYGNPSTERTDHAGRRTDLNRMCTVCAVSVLISVAKMLCENRVRKSDCTKREPPPPFAKPNEQMFCSDPKTHTHKLPPQPPPRIVEVVYQTHITMHIKSLAEARAHTLCTWGTLSSSYAKFVCAFSRPTIMCSKYKLINYVRYKLQHKPIQLGLSG